MLLRIMYKSIVYTLVFTGVKAKKAKVEGMPSKPTNIYSLKYLLPWWKKIEEHEDPLLSIKAMLVMWVVAVTGRHFSDATVASALVLLFLVASVFWDKRVETSRTVPSALPHAASPSCTATLVTLSPKGSMVWIGSQEFERQSHTRTLRS